MDQIRRERYGAASGFGMVVLGAAAAAFERSPATAADFAANRAALTTQSMLFLAGAAVTLWFLGSLRVHLRRAEGGSGRLTGVAFGAGIAWVSLTMLAQTFQIGVAADPLGQAPDALMATMDAVFAVANLPLAVMLIAVGVVSLRHRAFPSCMAWVAFLAAAAQLLLWTGAAVQNGPLMPGSWLGFVLYPALLVWLIPATTIMIREAPDPVRGKSNDRLVRSAS